MFRQLIALFILISRIDCFWYFSSAVVDSLVESLVATRVPWDTFLYLSYKVKHWVKTLFAIWTLHGMEGHGGGGTKNFFLITIILKGCNKFQITYPFKVSDYFLHQLSFVLNFAFDQRNHWLRTNPWCLEITSVNSLLFSAKYSRKKLELKL